MNPVLMLMETDSFDAFANDVANAYFQNSAHVRNLLNENFIDQCVDYVINNQQVIADLSDLSDETVPFFSKPSRQKGRRKHGKKEVRRKGSAKRFRDRSRKCASEGHTIHVYHRGMAGDWGVRGHRLAETGQVACKTNYRVKTNCADFIPDDNGTNDVTMTFGDVSMTMNQFNWKDYEEQWDAFCNAYAFHELRDNNDYSLWDEYWKQFESDEFIEIEDDFESDEDKTEDNDYIPDTPDTQFSAIEMADIVNQIAYATPDECVKIREFFRSL